MPARDDIVFVAVTCPRSLKITGIPGNSPGSFDGDGGGIYPDLTTQTSSGSHGSGPCEGTRQPPDANRKGASSGKGDTMMLASPVYPGMWCLTCCQKSPLFFLETHRCRWTMPFCFYFLSLLLSVSVECISMPMALIMATFSQWDALQSSSL